MSGTEMKAKRTHARRSCDMCKVRKTRCELPDLDFPSSPDPLSADKACHRCRVLGLPCIVDDGSRKVRKRGRDEPSPRATLAQAGSTTEAQTPPHRKSTRARRSSLLDSVTSNALNHTLDLMHGFTPALDDGTIISLDEVPIDPHLTAQNGASPAEAPRVKSMKLHGRPMELVCAMLKVAYGKQRKVFRKKLLDEEDLDLDLLVDSRMRTRLEPGVSQLRICHPYLESLPDLFSAYMRSPSQSTALLLALVIYLASLPLPADTAVTNLRVKLASYVTSLRDRALLNLEATFPALQAFEMLSFHAPLGVLPLQLANPRTLALARGYTCSANGMAKCLQFEKLVKHLIECGKGESWESTEIWLWMCLTADEARIALEDENPKKLASLLEARSLADSYLHPDHQIFWQHSLERDPAEAVGKLTVCDRLGRLCEVHDALWRLRRALESAAQPGTHFDLVELIVEELKYFVNRTEILDNSYEAVMASLSPSSGGVEAGWLVYRRIRRRYESNKVFVTGLRYLIASAFLPGSPSAFPNLPTHMTPVQGVLYAISRASNPSDIALFLRRDDPAVRAVWAWGTHRGQVAEQLLDLLAEMGRTLIPGSSSTGRAELVPIHDIACIAVETSKVLMEMQAASIMVVRTDGGASRSFKNPVWSGTMRQVSQELREVGMLLPDDPEQGGESIENGCSNLVGSMVRMADEWTKISEGDRVSPPTHGGVPASLDPALSSQSQSQPQPQSQSQAQVKTSPSSVANGETQFDPTRQHAMPGHQQYMDSSDRWMASKHDDPRNAFAPIPPMHNGQIPPQASAYPPTQLDMLLSEVFNYGYPHSQPQSQPPPPPPPPPSTTTVNTATELGHTHGHGHDPQMPDLHSMQSAWVNMIPPPVQHH
ncbi:hypothetical protein BCR39DRAFT_585803 [Naematelia encephala]|uniref:Zn(2)-C6 fungal-type domain-containing protein n=1 Tax=Naematelia encephala TaxID=71784 RepID=A0A1Y2BJC1_9TREE|nr:hypothetical protein BCR39DRAFT_585803 [Naematelia encephala]